MTYLAIVAWGADNRVTKYQDYPTEAEASAHVARVKDRFPNAFTTPRPGGGFPDWLINPAAKTLSVVALPPPPKSTEADRAESSLRSNPGALAMWRAISGNDALTEEAAVALARAKLP